MRNEILWSAPPVASHKRGAKSGRRRPLIVGLIMIAVASGGHLRWQHFAHNPGAAAPKPPPRSSRPRFKDKIFRSCEPGSAMWRRSNSASTSRTASTSKRASSWRSSIRAPIRRGSTRRRSPLAQRGLRHMDDGGSAGETASVDDVDEIAQMPHVHGAALARKAIMDPPIGPTVNHASRSAPECSGIPFALPVAECARRFASSPKYPTGRSRPMTSCNKAAQLPEVGLGSTVTVRRLGESVSFTPASWRSSDCTNLSTSARS
jgi:hypothetical protein